jgi:hypothetical protein
LFVQTAFVVADVAGAEVEVGVEDGISVGAGAAIGEAEAGVAGVVVAVAGVVDAVAENGVAVAAGCVVIEHVAVANVAVENVEVANVEVVNVEVEHVGVVNAVGVVNGGKVVVEALGGADDAGAVVVHAFVENVGEGKTEVVVDELAHGADVAGAERVAAVEDDGDGSGVEVAVVGAAAPRQLGEALVVGQEKGMDFRELVGVDGVMDVEDALGEACIAVVVVDMYDNPDGRQAPRDAAYAPAGVGLDVLDEEQVALADRDLAVEAIAAALADKTHIEVGIQPVKSAITSI